MWFAFVVALLAPDSGRLVVECPQYGRTVAVDRRPVGQTPLDPVDLSPGFHWVEILDGNETLWSRLVYMPPEGTLALSVSLPERRRSMTPSNGATAGVAVPATTYDLRGRMSMGGTSLGARHMLSLDQEWRLDIDGLAGTPLDARIEATVFNPLNDDADPLFGPLFVWPERPTQLTTATLTHTARGQRVSAGRHRPTAPTGELYLLDGVVARARPLPWLSLTSTFGRRALEPGSTYASHLVNGLKLAGQGAGFGLSAFALYHDGLYLGAKGSINIGPVSFTSNLYKVDEHIARLHSRARWRRNGGSIWFEASFRRQTEGGFEVPSSFDDLLTPPPLREIRGRMGGDFTAGPMTFEGQGMWRRGRPLGDERSPDVMAFELHAHLAKVSGRPGVRLIWQTQDEYDEDAPTLNGFLRARLATDWGPCALAVGMIQLALPAGQRRYPEGRGRCRTELTRPLYMFAGFAAEAIHPRLQPRAGPLVRWRVGLELR